ncbi:MAG: PIN domain-containing protein [Candidatus Aenigmatarchaeota archaeon]
MMSTKNIKKRIYLDTNFLIYAMRDRADISKIYEMIDSELEFLIPDTVIKELEKLSKRKSKFSAITNYLLVKLKKKLSIEEIGLFRYQILRTDFNNCDEYFFHNITDEDILCTNDKSLINILKKNRKSLAIIKCNRNKLALLYI